MRELYSELRWLSRVPRDFKAQLKSALLAQSDCGLEFQRLATAALDVSQLTSLAKAMGQLQSRGGSLFPLVPFRLGVLSNGTTDLIVPALVGSAARYGILLEVVRTPFDQVVQEAIRPDSHLNQARVDVVLLAVDHRMLPFRACAGKPEEAAVQLQSAVSCIRDVCEGIRSHSGALCIVPTFTAPQERLFGSLDRATCGTMPWLIESLNRELAAYVMASSNVLLDVAFLAETVGLSEWHDPRLWNAARIPFAELFVPLYADHVARVLAAILGKSRKVLILDLDNTVWGGVLGEDGIAGINLAQGDGVGESFLSVQRMALELRQRGILLAICSKNTHEIARSAIQQHPEMLLRFEHFAAFRANWDDKAANIRAIADQLSLGLDSMVFLDDHPAERQLVRQLLPAVAVPELPDDPALYARTLAAAGYFEAVTFSPEDTRRADLYNENAKRATLQDGSEGIEVYLESLQMTLSCEPFSESGRARVAQLINKTNQYNLTTRRYTLPEIISMETDPTVFTLQARLTDRFGDNGMISVVICRSEQASVWNVDTWLMSCRVLGRRVELEVFRELLERAKAEGVHTICGSYHPTDRNHLVRDHYERLGFTKIAVEPSGAVRWALSVDDARVESTSIHRVSSGFPLVHRQLAEPIGLAGCAPISAG